MIHVSGLYIYPLKSARGWSLTRCDIDAFGPRGDRRFMLVNRQGMFMTQRRHPQMALLHVAEEVGRWRFGFPGQAEHVLTLPQDAPVHEVQIWGEDIRAHDMGDEAAAWFSACLGEVCRLVYMRDDTLRPVDPNYAKEEAQVSFADGFPLLLISQGSLDDLNARLEETIGMERFRPNLVVSGVEAFTEDTWRRIRIGSIEFDIVKPCARCVLTTVEQNTGVKGKEPMRTLKTYRMFEGAVLFGQNLIHRGQGSIRIDDEVEVLETL